MRASLLRIVALVAVVFAAVSTATASDRADAPRGKTQPTAWKTAPHAQPLVIEGGNFKMNILRSELGSGVTVTSKGSKLEVRGCTPGKLATVVHGLIGGRNAHIADQGKAARKQNLSTRGRGSLNDFNLAMVRYGFARNFGGQVGADGSGKMSGSIYPVPKCWKMDCADCGAKPEGGPDCGDLEAAKDAAFDAYMEAAVRQQMWQTAYQAFKDAAFYGGVAGMVGDMVSAATTVLTAGGASGAAKAAAKIIVQMAKDGMLEAAMEEAGISGLADMTEAQVESKLSAAEAARVAANQALEAARAAWVKCMNNPKRMNAAQKKKYLSDLAAWDQCRYNVYMGNEPQCTMREVACP